jgi:KaiC/GvpD/RAD55 family RecA-like ATPase
VRRTPDRSLELDRFSTEKRLMPASDDPHPRSPNSSDRQPFGLDALDRHLGGGPRPGTLTVIAGATGAGKTQLGLRWLARGLADEGRRGVVVDLTTRGDPQHHEDYARDRHAWELHAAGDDGPLDPSAVFDPSRFAGALHRPFAHIGRRPTRPDVDPDAWHAWKMDLARALRAGAAFLYAHLARGARRVAFDGLEPTDRASESVQFDFLEYLVHRILRQDDEWAAREVLREAYRAHEPMVQAHRYNASAVGTLVLYTAPQVLLADLMAAPIGRGDLFATASTVVLMGRTSEAGHLGRALCVVKHRGSACRDELLPYRLTDRGLEFDEAGGRHERAH